MNEIDVKIHEIGTVTDALTGKEAEGLIVSFGEFKTTSLSWKSFKQLVGLRCPKIKAKTASSAGTSVGSTNGTSVSHGHATTTDTTK